MSQIETKLDERKIINQLYKSIKYNNFESIIAIYCCSSCKNNLYSKSNSKIESCCMNHNYDLTKISLTLILMGYPMELENNNSSICEIINFFYRIRNKTHHNFKNVCHNDNEYPCEQIKYHEHKKEYPSDIILNYCLFLPDYPNKFISSAVSFKHSFESKQSLGHYNSMSVRTLCDNDGNSIENQYIMFKGFRTPNDEDSNNLDENGELIVRNVKRMYFEEYEITVVNDKGINVGGLGGQLHYQDEGNGEKINTLTTVDTLNFPITQAYGIYREYMGGNINFVYDNVGIYLRTLTVSPPVALTC